MQAYDFKHLSLDLYIVRTNLNPRTIMRSPGFINSVMVSCHPGSQIPQKAHSFRQLPHQDFCNADLL